jgi:hypothetical protein
VSARRMSGASNLGRLAPRPSNGVPGAQVRDRGYGLSAKKPRPAVTMVSGGRGGGKDEIAHEKATRESGLRVAAARESSTLRRIG